MADDESKPVDTPAAAEEAPATEKKGRGRPKKADSAPKAKAPKAAKGTGGKRGRPKLAESEKKAPKPAGTGKRGRPKGSGTGSKPKTHPAVAEMVLEAVAALKDRRGCSLSAVKKYIAANYKVDMERQAIFIRRYVRKQIDNGQFTLVKGTSTTGSFKLADPADKKKKAAVKKPKAAGTPGKRGRPKGSKGKSPKKDKPKKAAKAKGSGKPRGRPKGSTKKKASE